MFFLVNLKKKRTYKVRLPGKYSYLCFMVNYFNIGNLLLDDLKFKKFSRRVTLCVELNTGEYSGELQYKPGDHIGILAKNRKELVEAVLARVTNSPPVDQLVQIEKLKEKTSVFGNHYIDNYSIKISVKFYYTIRRNKNLGC